MRKTTVCLLLCLGAVQGGRVRAGDDFVAAAARNAVEEYQARIDEIERVAAQRKAEAKQRLTQALGETARFEAEAGSRYRGMLGSYFNHEGRVPFILLSVPSGDNVMGEYARSVFNRHYNMSKPITSFDARGHVAVPKSGAYFLEASRGHAHFELNDRGYTLVEPAAGNRYRADVELAAGVYAVHLSVGNNGGQMPEAAIRIVDRATETELPIFIYESELKAFASDLSFGVELIETSKWTSAENRIE